MTEFKIVEINKFMGTLLKGDIFDDFLFTEGLIRTCIEYSYDGKLHKEWYDSSEQDLLGKQQYISWINMKNSIFEIIKGKHTPLLMNIKLIASDELTAEIVNNLAVNADETIVLNLNINYKAGELNVITGVYRSGFTLSKEADIIWDDFINQLFKTKNITFEGL